MKEEKGGLQEDILKLDIDSRNNGKIAKHPGSSLASKSELGKTSKIMTIISKKSKKSDQKEKNAVV